MPMDTKFSENDRVYSIEAGAEEPGTVKKVVAIEGNGTEEINYEVEWDDDDPTDLYVRGQLEAVA